MLEFYVESQLKLHHLRQSAVGAHLDDFADRLRLSGYEGVPNFV